MKVKANNAMTQIVRFYAQDFLPENRMDLNKFMKGYGLEIIKMKYSSFGACYFVEVKGWFKEDDILKKIKTTPNNFDWNV